ncbi:MAG: MobC family plasmid mobilization relaxosome protein [Clostridiales bacterium]|nr:MobC family plasmid mobilization relaxosome protein [Clostridiales bacterium]
MQKLKRSINMGFRVTQEEYDLIMKRMDEIGFPSTRSYLLKMALNGHIFTLDLDDVRECTRLLRILSNNLNQIAKRANETGNVYITDIADVKARLDEIWHLQDKTIKSLTKVLEVA